VKYSSATIRASVIEARKIQEKRFRLPGKYNGSMTTREITKFCLLSDSTSKLMEKAYRSLDLTARSYHRILKVSRTIADVDHSINIEEKHLLEALSYRGLQQKLGEMVR
jgi:magnesium chelatase family protein